jgi:hypothetical protein
MQALHLARVKDDEDLLLHVAHEPLHEADEALAVHAAFIDVLAHLALVGDGGDHRQALAFAVDAHHGRLPLERVATPAHVIAAQTCLGAPVDLGALETSTGDDLRVVPPEALVDRRGRLLARPGEKFLRREALAGQVAPDRTHRQRHGAALLDELAHRRTRP